MAITVKHNKVSVVPDGDDTSLVRPSDWNEDHVLTGTVPVANGGTGAATLTGYVVGNGTAAMTASTTIPSTDVTGLGTMSTQNSNNISVTGGSISGTTVSGYIPTTEKAVANGVATLDGGGTVPISQLPAAVLGALSYQGTWNASTNTPTLTSSVGTKGYYYVVSVAGSTNLNGITDWQVGDWAVYNGTAWQKIDNTDAVTSVNGYTGTVVLTTTDVAEGTNQYFTTARARTSVSAGTGISYVSGTGVITNSLPDQTVVLTAGTGISTTGTYPNFTITNTSPSSGGTVTSVTGTSPVVSSGGNTPVISMPAATTSVSGYLTSTDWTTFNNKGSGSVTSVAATVPSVFSIAGSPITTSGTLAITYSGTALPVLNGGTGVTTSTGTTNVVLSGSPTIVTPVIAQINDANGNAELKFSTIASAVNQVTIENAATGNPVHISATGTDTSIGIHLAPKGASGYVNVQGGVDSTKRFMLNPDGGTTNTRTMLSTSQTVDRTLTLPDATDTLVGKATTDTLTNKSISGSTNTLSNIGNASLTNSAITINGTSTSLGGSISVGTVTSVTGTSPVVSSGGATPAISMAAANTTTNGYLTSTDWNTFNGKGSGTVTSVTATSPVTSTGGTTPVIAMPAATTSVNGYLTSTDWTTFNNKGSGTVTSVAALTLGTTGTDLSSTVATGTTTPVITLQVPTASATNRGALSSTDWTTFNNKAASFTYTSTYIPYGQGTTTPNQASNFTFDGTTQSAPIQRASNGIHTNTKSIAASFTIPSTDNAMSSGPVTVASGQTVTVSSGSRWVVL